MEYFERCRCGHTEPDHSAFGTCRACTDCEAGARRDHPPRQCPCRAFASVEQTLAYGT